MATYFFETITAARALCFASKAGDLGDTGGGGKSTSEKAADEAAKTEAASPVAQANASQIDGAEPALIEADPTRSAPMVDDPVELKARLEEAQHALAAERSMRLAAEDRAASLRASMLVGGRIRAPRADGKVEVRVKTPLEIYPDAASWDYVKDGPPPASAKLQAGLNFVEPWVAGHWLVVGSLEDDFAADQAEAAAEEHATES